MFFLAITNAEVSRVVPITSAYPLVTVLLALLFLNEAFTVPRGLGILLVVCGVALLSR
jgi:transporter family protein